MLDGAREVLRDLHDAARLGPLAVRAHPEEVDAEREVDRAHEVRQEDEAPLEHADEDEVPLRVVARDLRAELVDARGDLLGREHGDESFGHGGSPGIERSAGPVNARGRARSRCRS